jgi:hypothetical protein
MIRPHSIWLLLTVSALVAGCVIVPVPSPEKRVVSGHPVVEDEVHLIAAGGQDANAIKARLGEPLADFGPGRVYVYGWTVKKGSILWAVGGAGAAAAGIEPWVVSHLLFIAFDTEGKVLTAGTSDFKPSETLAKQVRDWLASVQLEAKVVSPRLDQRGLGRALLVVYRPSCSPCPFPTFDSNIFKPSVDVNGVVVGDLERGKYLTAELEPGDHAITIDPVPDYRFAGQETSFFVKDLRSIRLPATLKVSIDPRQPLYVEAYLCTGTGKINVHVKVLDAPVTAEVIQDLQPAW